ncbi:MAG: TonB-dependent receptor [Candidatus Eisenbacteria bacterium]|nr:TonB-dependent receptor [Candidatus Eisenbacteria bacterium]
MKIHRSFATLALCAALAASPAHPAQSVGNAGSGASTISAARDSSVSDTLAHVVPLEQVEVSTTRTGEHAPFARTTLDREALRSLNAGQDTPMALATLPGAYAYSDAGNGIGYSYLSLRGFPQRRISVLINGVPLNDPESHEVYWIDHPDLLASTSEVEVQRGVGSALYGAASLGGSVNLETGPAQEAPSASALAAWGSFDTRRVMLEMNSGALAGGWNVYGRYSRIETNGYREQSFSRLWSYALSARRTLDRQSFRVNLYGGPEETHLAYLAVPADYLDGLVTGNRDHDRRFNPITWTGERDHFFEPHYELIHSWAPSRGVLFSQTLFYFDGRGYYDELRTAQYLSDYRLSPWLTTDSTLAPRDYYQQDGTGALTQDGSGRFTLEQTDVTRRRQIVNRHYGWVPRVRIEHADGALTLGGEIRAHDGHHVGEVLSGGTLPPGTPPDPEYYDYHPRTLAAGLFAREERSLPHALRLTADLAWRHQEYVMERDAFDGIRFDQTYDFALPRLALAWAPRKATSAFASWSYASREPSFQDLYDGEGPGSVPLFENADVVNNVYGDALVRPEHVHDFELGGAWRAPSASLTVNLFRMDFRDELVYAGQFNTDLGYPILGNAAQSVHQGIEFAARAEHALAGHARGAIDANATLSDNHFVHYREVYGLTSADTLRYDGNSIALFPAVMANLAAHASRSGVTLGAELQYAGRIYVDNSQSMLASICPRTVLNFSAAWRAKVAGASAAELSLRVVNALDTRYATSGYMDYDAAGNLVPQFVPAATRGVTGQLRVDF